MTDAMEVLFNYAQEWLEPPLLLSESEYATVQRCVREQELLLFFKNRAMFLAGFRLAAELSR